MVGGSGDILTRSATANVGGGSASTSFFAAFGSLKGQTHANLSTTGSATASSSGLFSSFNNFVGASFYDTITLAGPGVVTLSINYSLHSINSDSNALTFAETQLKMDTYSLALGNQNAGAIVHSGAGNRTDSGVITVSGVAGQQFFLEGELSSLSSVIYGSSDSGTHTAESDALHTGTVWITPTSGSFTSASGSSYMAPVPEPMTIVVLGLGSGMLLRRRSRK